MTKSQQAHQLKLTYWINQFHDQSASGLTVREWCSQNNVSIHAYNYWKHQVKIKYLEQTLPNPPDIVPISFAPTSKPLTATPLNIDPCFTHESRESRNSQSTLFQISINGIHLAAEASVSNDQLLRIIQVLRHA